MISVEEDVSKRTVEQCVDVPKPQRKKRKLRKVLGTNMFTAVDLHLCRSSVRKLVE